VNPWEQRFELLRTEADVRPMRASDQDRLEAVLALSDQYAEGRLDADEFERRQAIALQATFLHDLDPLFTDLPGRSAPRAGGAAGGAAYGVPAGAPPWAGRRGPRGGGVPFLALFVTLLIAASFAGVGQLLWLAFPVLWIAMAARHRRRWTMAHAMAPAQVHRR
jgi:hypothetical protein